MNATSPQPTWAIGFLGLVCVGLTLGSVVLAVALLARRSDRPTRRVGPSEPNPALRAVGMFLLLLLGLAGAGLFAVVLYLDLSTDFVHPSTAAWLIPAGSMAVGVLCFLGFRAVARGPRREPRAPAGIGYLMLCAAWIVETCALGFAITGYAVSRTERYWLVFSRHEWEEVFGGCMTIAIVLALLTAVRFTWVNRRRIAAAVSYAHEPDLPRAAPAAPIILPTPVPVAAPVPPAVPRTEPPRPTPASAAAGSAVRVVVVAIAATAALVALVLFGFVTLTAAVIAFSVLVVWLVWQATAARPGGPLPAARSAFLKSLTNDRVTKAVLAGVGAWLGLIVMFGVIYGLMPDGKREERGWRLGVLFVPMSIAVMVVVVSSVSRAGRKFREVAGLTEDHLTPPAAAPAPLPPAPPRVCPKCGAAVAADAAQGLCPRCLLGAMMPVPERLSPTIAHGPFVPPTVEEVAEFFPQFEVLRIIGQGGMGAVYLARQKALDRLVAIKLIRTAHEDDPTFVARFVREARAMAKLGHPNIVAVHDTGEAGGLPYLVMEYVDGVTLRDAIRTKSVTPAEALAIIPQICDALEYAHKHGVVHRDIKPENILLDANGRVKIADFGLAKLADPDSMSLTGTMQAMGTPHYMAPEQWEKPGEVDHRADIYALGVVLYELLTGELPLGRFDPPSVKSRVDARIDELVLRALAKEPGRRYQHATDVKLALAKIAASPGWVPRSGFEYKSKATLLGWPLVHVVARRDPAHGYPTVAKGWVAVGTGTAIGGIAIGGSGALGGIALAGGGAVGVFALGGGCAIGLLALAGGWAAGGVAVGGGAGIGAYLGVGGGFAFGGNYAVAGGGAYAPVASSGESPNPQFWPQLRDAVSVIWQSVGGLFRR